MILNEIKRIGENNNLAMLERYSMFLSNIEKATFRDFEKLFISEIKFRHFYFGLDEFIEEWIDEYE